MFQRLLICTDLTDGLQRLVQFVPSLAAGGIQHITFLHVMPIDGREIPRIDETKVQQIREQLAVDPATIPTGVEVKVEVQTGRIPERVLATAQADQIDVIMLGTTQQSLLSEKLFGSTAITLCQARKVPILMMRPQLISSYTVEELKLRCRHLFRYLLLPINGSNASQYLVSTIQQQVQQQPNQALQQCFLLWVVEDNDRIDKLLYDSRMQEAEAGLAGAKAKLEAAHLEVVAQIGRGEPIPETLRIALEYDITAIALASDTLGKLAEWSKPSFTAELLRRSWHPVLFIPSP
jgi:nucleotide-binding universal stress UspA family protein